MVCTGVFSWMGEMNDERCLLEPWINVLSVGRIRVARRCDDVGHVQSSTATARGEAGRHSCSGGDDEAAWWPSSSSSFCLPKSGRGIVGGMYA